MPDTWQRILILGCNGQMGWRLNNMLPALGEVIALDYPEIDYTRPRELMARIKEIKPDLIVNAAAYTNVNEAETDLNTALMVNGAAAAFLTEACNEMDAFLIHYSTDYVFDGQKNTPYLETDKPKPLSYYGFTKMHGDFCIQELGRNYIIIRSSWLYDLRGNNFFLTIKRLAAEREKLGVVDDQIGTPTWCHSLAQATFDILAQGRRNLEGKEGIYNITCQGETSWYGFASAIIEKLKGTGIVTQRVIPIKSDEYPTAAVRPAYSVLSNEKVNRVFNIYMPTWEEALNEVMVEVKRET